MPALRSQPLISDLDLRSLGSDPRPLASDLRHAAPDLRPLGSDLRPLGSDLLPLDQIYAPLAPEKYICIYIYGCSYFSSSRWLLKPL